MKGTVTAADCAPNARGMSRWAEALRTGAAYGVEDPAYEAVFLGRDLSGRPTLIGSVGRYAGMRVFVSDRRVRGEIDVDGRTLGECEIVPENGLYGSVPFADVFRACKILAEKLKELLGDALAAVPLCGGIKSIVIAPREQKIADWFIGEEELFGTENERDFRRFSTGRFPGEIPMPERMEESGKNACGIVSAATEPATREEYLEKLECVLDALRAGEADKVVIARKCTVTAASSFDPLAYAFYLLERYYQAYYYIFSMGGRERWIGISPEVMIRKCGSSVYTQPLAGSVKKTGRADEDAKRKAEFAVAAKERAEHDAVLFHMKDMLERADIGTVFVERDKDILETPYAMHFMSELTVRLKDGVSVFDAAAALYPPAAVWGVPEAAAERLISQAEPFCREYYSGLFGYCTAAGNADMALVIRTAKVDGCKVGIFAGGGILKESDAASEFDETVQKMRPLLRYFKAEDG